MTAILRQESRKRIRGSVILVAVFGLLSAMYFSIFPDYEEDAEALVEAFPQYMFDFFGLEALDTIEGFIAAEIYSFFWVLLVGIYFAYVGAGMIVRDIENRRMDLTLSYPVSRESVMLQKFASFWVPVVVLNTTIPVIVYVGSVLIDSTINPVALAMVHLLSVPYLLVCAGIGILCSVTIDRVRTAQATAFGLVIVLWLVDSASALDPDYEWVGDLTPSRYYNETAILVREEYAYLDALILLIAFLFLVVVSVVLFVRRDIE